MTVQIDWRNPLTRGLFRANIPSGPYSVNLVSSRISAPAAGTYSTGVSRVGRVQYGSATGAQTSLNPYATDSIFKNHVDNVFTMACLVYLPDTYTSPSMVMGEGIAASSSSTSLVRTVNFTDAWEVRFRTSFAGPIIVTTDDAVDAVIGGTYLIVASMNRNAPTDKCVFDVYRLDTGAQERVTSTEDVTNDFTGYDSFAFGIGDDVGAALQLTWNRELTKAERDSLAENPWQLFKAQPIIGAHQLPTHVDYGMVKMPWTSQPPAGTPIDWGNPLAQGLVFLTVGTDPDRDLVDGRVGTVTGTLGPTIDPKYGIGVDHDETNWIEFTHVPRYSSDFVSATCIVNPDNLTGANYQEVMRKGDNSGTQDYDLLLNFPSGGEINFNIWNSGAKSSPGAPLTIGETSVVTGTYNGAELRIYKDGREYGSPTAWTGGIEQSTDSLGVGARVKGTVDRKTDAQIYFVAVHNRALSAGEIRSLHENPWQIFKPKEIMVPINEDLPELGRFEIQS